MAMVIFTIFTCINKIDFTTETKCPKSVDCCPLSVDLKKVQKPIAKSLSFFNFFFKILPRLSLFFVTLHIYN